MVIDKTFLLENDTNIRYSMLRFVDWKMWWQREVTGFYVGITLIGIVKCYSTKI